MSIAYVNDDFVPLAEARVSPLDRGFLFADGVYEVIPVYGGRLFRLEEHLARLERSLESIRLANPRTRAGWIDLLGELVARNGGADQSVYMQITRGVAPRNHPFPDGSAPGVFAMSKPTPGTVEPRAAAAIVRPDNRWGRCDIKSIALLANVLLRQEAADAGARETILVRDGVVTEGSASNVFVVRDDFVVTPPKGPAILAGVTRDLVLELAEAAGLPCVEAAVGEDELHGADEIWITSSTLEVTPVTTLDGARVGGGQPGPVWRKVRELFSAYKDDHVAAAG